MTSPPGRIRAAPARRRAAGAAALAAALLALAATLPFWLSGRWVRAYVEDDLPALAAASRLPLAVRVTDYRSGIYRSTFSLSADLGPQAQGLRIAGDVEHGALRATIDTRPADASWRESLPGLRIDAGAPPPALTVRARLDLSSSSRVAVEGAWHVPPTAWSREGRGEPIRVRIGPVAGTWVQRRGTVTLEVAARSLAVDAGALRVVDSDRLGAGAELDPGEDGAPDLWTLRAHADSAMLRPAGLLVQAAGLALEGSVSAGERVLAPRLTATADALVSRGVPYTALESVRADAAGTIMPSAGGTRADLRHEIHAASRHGPVSARIETAVGGSAGADAPRLAIRARLPAGLARTWLGLRPGLEARWREADIVTGSGDTLRIEGAYSGGRWHALER